MKEITPSELKSMIDNNEEFQLIDVRDQYEIDLCNIGELILISMIFLIEKWKLIKIKR